MKLKMTYLKLNWNPPGANELNHNWVISGYNLQHVANIGYSNNSMPLHNLQLNVFKIRVFFQVIQLNIFWYDTQPVWGWCYI